VDELQSDPIFEQLHRELWKQLKEETLDVEGLER
jgi:hypothetical protein